MQHNKVALFRKKTEIMVVNSKIKHKSKTILGVIRSLVLDFFLYFVTAYIIWESSQYMYHEHMVQHQIHYTSLEDVSKKIFMPSNLQQELHTKIFKLNYDEKCTYNVNTHCNLLYALKV